MMLLKPHYKGLLTNIFKRQHLAEDFSLYLHRPTATDPSLAPEGCDTFYVLSPVPHLGSGTTETRTAMADLAADNVIAVLSGRPPVTPIP